MKPVSETQKRILDAAEELFADQGLDRVSIRDITDAAKVNLAAVNYHFGTKEELIAAVFDRRLVPLNLARLAALDEVERKAVGHPPKLEDILSAFVRPALECCLQDSSGAHFGKLFGRCMAETRPEIEALLIRQFEPLMHRIDTALMRTLPNLPRAEIFWRMKFTFGALHHWLLTMDRFVPPWGQGVSVEDQTKKLISFAAAGFRVP